MALFAAALLAVLLPAAAVEAAPTDVAVGLAPKPPRFELTLSLAEFSVLHDAAVAGVARYGGDADFRLRIVRAGDAMEWRVTIAQPVLLDAWTVWMKERTAELVTAVDVEALGEPERRALQVSQSLHRKLAAARAAPIFDPVTLRGRVVADGERLALDTAAGTVGVSGARLDELRDWLGRTVNATGIVRVENQLEVERFADGKENTLELFVMSQCPFAATAEQRLGAALATLAVEARPAVEVRYLFAKQGEGREARFTSLHGEPEVAESLVQMLIRDAHPTDVFWRYLAARNADPSGPWRDLALRSGVAPPEADLIAARIERERDALIGEEYAYVAEAYPFAQASPTWVWEGAQIDDLSQVPELIIPDR